MKTFRLIFLRNMLGTSRQIVHTWIIWEFLALWFYGSLVAASPFLWRGLIHGFSKERAREKCLPIEGPNIVQKWLVVHRKSMEKHGGVIDLRHPPYHILNKTILSLGDN